MAQPRSIGLTAGRDRDTDVAQRRPPVSPYRPAAVETSDGELVGQLDRALASTHEAHEPLDPLDGRDAVPRVNHTTRYGEARSGSRPGRGLALRDGPSPR